MTITDRVEKRQQLQCRGSTAAGIQRWLGGIVRWYVGVCVRGNQQHPSNVPSNFLKAVCAQNFLCATFTSTYLYLERCISICFAHMKYVQKVLLKKIYVRSKFSCVHSSHDLCAHAHAHSLEGTLHSSNHQIDHHTIYMIYI